MNHFEQNFASIFGPESHRRKLTPENNKWKRVEQECAERRALENQRKFREQYNVEAAE